MLPSTAWTRSSPSPGSLILWAKPLPSVFETQGNVLICTSCPLIIKDRNPPFFGTVEPIHSWSREWMRRGWLWAMFSWLGAQAVVSRLGRTQLLWHREGIKVSDSGDNLCTHIHALNTSEAKLLILIPYYWRRKAISSPFFLLVNKHQLLELGSGFDFPGLLIISGALSCEEEGRKQPDFRRAGWSLTWICLPNPVLQWEWI